MARFVQGFGPPPFPGKCRKNLAPRLPPIAVKVNPCYKSFAARALRTKWRMETLTFKNAARVNTSWLAPLEKPALLWLAERMPSRIGPDHLSVLGLLAMLGAGVGYWLSRGNPLWLHFVNLMLLCNWFGDSLDGTIARVRDCQRPRYGFYVDHIIDTFGAFFLFGGLALSGYMSVTIALLTLTLYLMLAINSYLAAYTLGNFSISVAKFSPTELRLLLIAGNVALLSHARPKIFGHKFLLFDIGGVVAMVLMFVIFTILSAQNTARLYRLESSARKPQEKLPEKRDSHLEGAIQIAA